MKYKHSMFRLNTYLSTHTFKHLFLGIVMLFITACAKDDSKPTIILIPENYVGSFYIIFNVPKGQPPKYEYEYKHEQEQEYEHEQEHKQEIRVYEIPASGVLLTQTNLNTSTLHYYYANNDGTRTAITERWTTSLHDTPENRQDKRTIIFGGGIGVIEPTPDCEATELSFAVGTKSDMLDNINTFDIYDAKGIKGTEKSIFDGMCPKREAGEPSIYLLPENYTGSFYIIYNTPNGQPSKQEQGVQVYEIPASGLLLTQASARDTWADSPSLQYYYVNNDGPRTAITGRWSRGFDDTPENRKDKQLMVFRSNLGGFELLKGCRVQGQLFAVGTRADIWDSNTYFDFNNIDKSIFEKSCFKP